jgi:ubiquinone/menaquinone biosynthesis C-methylase UbiE
MRNLPKSLIFVFYFICQKNLKNAKESRPFIEIIYRMCKKGANAVVCCLECSSKNETKIDKKNL